MTVQKYYDPSRGPDKRKRQPHLKSKTWKVTNLQAIHHAIVRELHIGTSGRRIAEKLNVSEVMVSNVRNSPAVKAKLDILEAATDLATVDVKAMIIRKAPACLETLHSLMESDDGKVSPTLKARIAMDGLDRAGHSAIKQVDTRNLHHHRFVNEDDIAAMKKRAIELGVLSGQIIDVKQET